MNKAYTHQAAMDIPRFNGTHADLLFLVSVHVCLSTTIWEYWRMDEMSFIFMKQRERGGKERGGEGERGEE